MFLTSIRTGFLLGNNNFVLLRGRWLFFLPALLKGKSQCKLEALLLINLPSWERWEKLKNQCKHTEIGGINTKWFGWCFCVEQCCCSLGLNFQVIGTGRSAWVSNWFYKSFCWCKNPSIFGVAAQVFTLNKVVPHSSILNSWCNWAQQWTGRDIGVKQNRAIPLLHTENVSAGKWWVAFERKLDCFCFPLLCTVIVWGITFPFIPGCRPGVW